MINRLMVSADDLGLLRLFVLLRAAKGSVSEESLLAELKRRRIDGVTRTVLHRLLSSLLARGLIRVTQGDESVVLATRQGQKVARETRARLLPLIALLQ